MSDVLSDVLSEYSESISSLLTHGANNFAPAPSKYVIHTSSIPLATTVDLEYLLFPKQSDEENTYSLFHGYKLGEREEIHCSLKSCMYTRKNKTRCREYLHPNCPCRAVGELKPLCFMMYLKSLNSNLVPMESANYTFPFRSRLNPSEIMFCHNSNSILDNKYPGNLRDKIQVTGWSHVTRKEVVKLLRNTWWFREHEVEYKLRDLTLKAFRTDKSGRHVVSQTLHTINSLLVKKMFGLGPELSSYREISRQTAASYATLIQEYCLDPVYEEGLLVEPKISFYNDCKNFSNLVKSSFHKPNRLVRIKWMDYVPSTRQFQHMFGSELRRLKAFTENQWTMYSSDYSMSPSFMYRAIMLTQNRGLGYLPPAIAEVKRMQFRNCINREPTVLDRDKAKLIYTAMRAYLFRSNVPENLLRQNFDEPVHETMKRTVFSSIEVVLKGTASVDTYVKDGGKLEDARRVLEMADLNAWEIPVRDLETLLIKEFISVERSTELGADFSRTLFWISFQLILNHWSNQSSDSPWKKFYHGFLDRGKPFEPNIMGATIVHISEPGKERNLTKSSAFLAWFLAPAAKVLQSTLALIPEHRAGLLESGQDWRHLKRISSESEEAGFLFDPSSGFLREEIVQIFKDWTESTDFIMKHVGYLHTRAGMEYIGFPTGYQNLVLKTIVEPQPVTEVVHRHLFDSEEVIEPVIWTGAIREGFMMGNYLTKPILHSIHCTELEISRQFLLSEGIRLERSDHNRVVVRPPVRLDRELTRKAGFRLDTSLI